MNMSRFKKCTGGEMKTFDKWWMSKLFSGRNKLIFSLSWWTRRCWAHLFFNSYIKCASICTHLLILTKNECVSTTTEYSMHDTKRKNRNNKKPSHAKTCLYDLSTLETFVDTRGTETHIETYAVGSPNHRSIFWELFSIIMENPLPWKEKF